MSTSSVSQASTTNWNPFPSMLQNSLARVFTTTASLLLPSEEKEITLKRHPLQDLYSLLEKAVQAQQTTDLGQTLYTVPENLRNHIFLEVYLLATDSNKGGNSWGEQHALENPGRLLNAIKNVVEKKLQGLPQTQKNALFGTIYRMAGQPQVHDLQWGEHNATKDTKRLMRALHRHHHLGVSGRRVFVLSDVEKDVPTPSCLFHLHRKELPRGQIGLQNGMQTSFQRAYNNACTISEEAAQGYNLHCSYGATLGIGQDLSSAILGQGGSVTPPVLQLLEQWQDFFESKDDERLLQLCHSRGAIEVNNALSYLPEELKKRILVITIAPACLIAANQAHKVLNLVIPSDPVVQVATNRQLLEASYTIKLPNHANTTDPHHLQGSSYIDKLKEMIEIFIRTNDIA